jgi:hypothetical protein
MGTKSQIGNGDAKIGRKTAVNAVAIFGISRTICVSYLDTSALNKEVWLPEFPAARKTLD